MKSILKVNKRLVLLGVEDFMAELNIYYNKNDKTWWINKDFDGFTLRNYISENPIGLGTVEFKTNDKTKITDLYEVNQAFIPDYIKRLNGITEELEDNGLENAIKVTEQQLEGILKK
jgi:hypothetical protein